jgi:NAD(P)-dependent dehydrogenase (short-subunit alcohol dehydrogenase family)
MNKRFVDKTIFITGAGTGIGRETAIRFAGEGARVAVVDISQADGAETLRLLQAEGGTGIYIHADVSNAESLKSAVEKTVAAFGGLDGAVNNAGIEGDVASTVDYLEESFDRVIAVNLKGVWLGMKYEIPYLLQRGGGTIVNTASIAGLIAEPGAPAYNASKGGVIQLTKTAALEFARKNIRVNAVCPGGVATPMLQRVFDVDPDFEKLLVKAHPVRRLGTPREIADAILFLSSSESSFMTGHAMVIDGGLTAQ